MSDGRSGQHLTVREYAYLTTSPVSRTLDQAQITETAFEWLCEVSSRMRGESGVRLIQEQSRQWLRLDNFVGVLETPCGLKLEILPKHVDGTGDITKLEARRLLRRMLEVALDLPPRQSEDADLQQFRLPIFEWVIQRFLTALDDLVKRGMRHDYVRVQEEQRFVRGQLDMAKQVRSGPARAHVFNIRHDIFSVDRAENRLLQSALLKVARTTTAPDNWRLANELRHRLSEVPCSQAVRDDFRVWSTDRLMAHYQPLRRWCELVLGDLMPLALAGASRGISMLFPMERLFERFVGHGVRAQISEEHRLIKQSSRHSLCTHLDSEFFLLKPDFLIEGARSRMVLDAKWKLLDSTDRKSNYSLKQSDFYQLFAYGHKYLDGCGCLALIYPRTAAFTEPLAPFNFSTTLRLVVLPFDLQEEVVVGLNALTERFLHHAA